MKCGSLAPPWDTVTAVKLGQYACVKCSSSFLRGRAVTGPEFCTGEVVLVPRSISRLGALNLGAGGPRGPSSLKSHVKCVCSQAFL